MTIQSVYNRVVLIVLDGFGVGALPDAARYGDEGTNTLANLAAEVGGLRLPHLERLGLGRITAAKGISPAPRPAASFGKAAEKAPAKDSMTGHWELMGYVTPAPFAIHAKGFSAEIVSEFCKEAKIPGVLGNCAASGTEIIERLGREHLKTKLPILYTSTDSVFQVAAHEDAISLERLYEICEAARRVCDRHRIGRVIARPFLGEPGSFRRTYERKDFCMQPAGQTALDLLASRDIPIVGIGKIHDLFGGKGVPRSLHTEGNRDGMAATVGMLLDQEKGLIFTNLVDFDTLWGHRRNPRGFAKCLEEFDEDLGALLERLKPGDLLILSSDHGNDPTFSKTTDHTREYVPILLYDAAKPAGRDLGTRGSFSDVGATVAAAFGLRFPGKSMLE